MQVIYDILSIIFTKIVISFQLAEILVVLEVISTKNTNQNGLIEMI
jgi:hypothetical protein